MQEVIVIAEAGVNHNGELEKALKMIEVAAIAGADYVKFQTFTAKKLVTKRAKKAKYQQLNTAGENDQLTMLKQLEMPLDWYPKLLQHCEQHKIGFLSTGFDLESIDFLANLGQKIFKIPSGEITHKSLLKKVATKNRPTIVSTGMANLAEIKAAVTVLIDEGMSRKDITVLHCTTAYPTPLNEVNLNAMNTIAQEIGINVGYSDHTLGIAVSLAAVALGAKVIEKHFTLDPSLPGPDHKASLSPEELTQLVQGIRAVSQSIQGDGEKTPTPTELMNKSLARKSLCFVNRFEKGHIIQESDLIALRPEDGISPMQCDTLIGKILKADVLQYQAVKLTDLI